MLVKLVWPDCTLSDRRWGAVGCDAFWLQCSEEEAQVACYPRATSRLDEQKGRPSPPAFGPPVCFLVSRDLTSIVEMPWVFPHSGMWNAYCPFRALPKPVVVASLDEIPNIDIPDALRGE
jgi:hypothetical protein